MEEVGGVAEYRDRLLALPCIKDTSYPRSLPIDKYADDDDDDYDDCDDYADDDDYDDYDDYD